MPIQEIYQNIIIFSSLKHSEKGQTIPGTRIPYVVHLSNVTMEIFIAFNYLSNFDLEFAVSVALLHDILEDTNTSFEELIENFGNEISEAVLALTKNNNLQKTEKISDSLKRIRLQRKEVWIVKLADRITNLQCPPEHWSNNKRISYQKEAQNILNTLRGCNKFLENRLQEKIYEYEKYIKH